MTPLADWMRAVPVDERARMDAWGGGQYDHDAAETRSAVVLRRVGGRHRAAGGGGPGSAIVMLCVVLSGAVRMGPWLAGVYV